MKIQLIKANQLKSSINNMLGKKLSITLSLAYYSMIHGNAEPLKSFPKTITSELDTKTKAFICLKFDSKSNTWVYNKSKAEKLISELNLGYKVSTFEEFCTALNTKMEEQIEVAPVDYDKRGRTQIANAVKSLKEVGLDDSQIIAILKDALIQAATPVALKTAA